MQRMGESGRVVVDVGDLDDDVDDESVAVGRRPAVLRYQLDGKSDSAQAAVRLVCRRRVARVRRPGRLKRVRRTERLAVHPLTGDEAARVRLHLEEDGRGSARQTHKLPRRAPPRRRARRVAVAVAVGVGVGVGETGLGRLQLANQSAAFDILVDGEDDRPGLRRTDRLPHEADQHETDQSAHQRRPVRVPSGTSDKRRSRPHASAPRNGHPRRHSLRRTRAYSGRWVQRVLQLAEATVRGLCRPDDAATRRDNMTTQWVVRHRQNGLFALLAVGAVGECARKHTQDRQEARRGEASVRNTVTRWKGRGEKKLVGRVERPDEIGRLDHCVRIGSAHFSPLDPDRAPPVGRRHSKRSPFSPSQHVAARRTVCTRSRACEQVCAGARVTGAAMSLRPSQSQSQSEEINLPTRRR
ncbi:unnamed protein product [Protopolystoma xenopodis]|uniref:Uncharacterized protein n=1 Tax=Protopolystoma xenopodis TaxID=117903 RepID=A0A448XBB4_9PLAT|nr:unnamed protein product [Protopolystoma xenopodis]